MSTILLVILVLALLGRFADLAAQPRVGYGPSGVLGLVLVVVLLMALLDRAPI